MLTPKEFVKQAIEMETFFEDEEPTFDVFMRYPPFDTLMGEKFSVKNLIKSYREGRIVFVVRQGKVYANNGASFQMSYRCNFLTKDYPNTIFQIEKLGDFTFDELNPTSVEDETHDALMNVVIEQYYTTQSDIKNKTVKFSGLTLEQESALSKVLGIILSESARKSSFDDGQQYLSITYTPDQFTLYSSEFLKIYQPFNTDFPNDLIKKLNEMFDNQKL
tara:strand:- start:2672 stop:3328 length:657 start_codon:yes stop_codon:yes gene_type:complete